MDGEGRRRVHHQQGGDNSYSGGLEGGRSENFFSVRNLPGQVSLT